MTASDTKKPVIVISCGNTESPEIRTKLLVQYIHRLGGIPVLADHSKLGGMAELVEAADGIIVQGNGYAPEDIRFSGQNRGFSSKLANGETVTFQMGEEGTTNIMYPDGNAVTYPGRLLPVPASVIDQPVGSDVENWYLADPHLIDLRNVDGINKILRVDPETGVFYDADKRAEINLPDGCRYDPAAKIPNGTIDAIHTNDGKIIPVDGRLLDLRSVDGINKLLVVDPETKILSDAATGAVFNLPENWEYKPDSQIQYRTVGAIYPKDAEAVILEGMLVDPKTREVFPRNQIEQVSPLVESPLEVFHPSLSFKPDEHKRWLNEMALLGLAEIQGSKESPAVARDSSNLPVLSICGGFQGLASLHGAPLIQIINEEVEKGLPPEKRVTHYSEGMNEYKTIPAEVRKALIESQMHIGNLPDFGGGPEVEVLDGPLREILGTPTCHSISTHMSGHLAASLPPELELTAVSSNDGIAEGFRWVDPRNSDRFFHAVQFHPDAFQTPEDFKLIEALMVQARERAAVKPEGVPTIPKELFSNPVVLEAIDQIKDLPTDKPLPGATPWQRMLENMILENAALAELIPAGLLSH